MEEKSKKLDAGRALFNTYKSEKYHKTQERADAYYNATVEEIPGTAQSFSMSKKKGPDNEKMDSATLKRKTDDFEHLNTTIKHLQDTLSEKKEIISSLEVQNEILREGTGDHSGVTQRESDNKTIQRLQTMVDTRDKYINEISDSLKKRSDELEGSLKKEKELTVKIEALQQEINTKAKQTGTKLVESYTETVEYKAQVDLLRSQIQEKSDEVQSLRSYLASSTKSLSSQQDKLNLFKNQASEDVRSLMSQVEELNHDVSNKEKELIASKRDLEKLEKIFEEKVKSLKDKLEMKYAEDVKKVELLYDDMFKEHIRKSNSDLQALGKCDFKDQIESCRLKYETEINTYKDNLKNLLEKSKSSEQRLLMELDKCKHEADYYKQQVENIENKLSDEVQKMKQSCYFEVNKCEIGFETYKENCIKEKMQDAQELDRLASQLREYAIDNAKKEVDLETYKDELRKREDNISSLIGKLSKYKEEKDNLIIELNQYKENCSCLQARLAELENNESKLKHEIEVSRVKLTEINLKVSEFNEQLRNDSVNFAEKYNSVVKSYEEKIKTLTNELEDTKSLYENDLLRLTFESEQQQKEIKTLETKLTTILTVDKANIEGPNYMESNCTDSELYDQIDKSSAFIAKSKLQDPNKEYLFSILIGLRSIKSHIKALMHSDTENSIESVDVKNDVEVNKNISYKELTQDLEKTICDIVSITQSLHLSLHGNVSFEIPLSDGCKPLNMITSTPNVKYRNVANKNNSEDYDSLKVQLNEVINSWMRKCARLENDNGKLSKEVEILTTNLKQLEYCLSIATQESSSFNKKCKILDAKMSELEKSKLSQYLLKKENNELKEKLSKLEELKKTFNRELEILNDENIKIEEKFNKNILDLSNKLSQSQGNCPIEVKNVLSNLKEKSEEIILLKSKLASVHKSEVDQSSRIQEIESKYEKFKAMQEFLMAELATKKRELEDVWEERNKISTENKLLQTKLCSVKEKSSMCLLQEHYFMDSNVFNDDKGYTSEKEMRSVQSLTAPPALTHDLEVLAVNDSIANRIGYQLQLIDQMDDPLNCHMPTILEEELEEDGVNGLQLTQVPH